jgi:membrane protease YdiL (CAAX protease family)
VRLGAGEGVLIALVSYSVYVISSLALYRVLPLMAGAAVSAVLLPATAYYLLWKVVGRPWRYVRLQNLKPMTGIYTILAAIALIPAAASLMAVVISILHVPEAWIEATYQLVKADNLPQLLRVWVVTALLVAIGEEFVFRGVLQTSLSSKVRPWASILVASAVFGALHVWRFPSAFMLGIFLGVLYEMSGSLLAPIIAHITVNSAVVVGSFLLSRVKPETAPGWLRENTTAPLPVLALSLVFFALLMHLIWKDVSAGRGWGPGDDPGRHGDGAA